MPMFGPRYHMNPAMGRALEEARAMHEEPATPKDGEELKHESAPGRDTHGRFTAPGPVHRVEIQRANGGFIASVHRNPGIGPVTAAGQGIHASEEFTSHGALGGVAHDLAEDAMHGGNGAAQGTAFGHVTGGVPANGGLGHPEVHVFSSHHDLVNFLNTELGRH
jgi:hypothetical protein